MKQSVTDEWCRSGRRAPGLGKQAGCKPRPTSRSRPAPRSRRTGRMHGMDQILDSRELHRRPTHSGTHSHLYILLIFMQTLGRRPHFGGLHPGCISRLPMGTCTAKQNPQLWKAELKPTRFKAKRLESPQALHSSKLSFSLGPVRKLSHGRPRWTSMLGHVKSAIQGAFTRCSQV